MNRLLFFNSNIDLSVKATYNISINYVSHYHVINNNTNTNKIIKVI